MKRIFLLGITLMVSAALLMTACKKDNPQPDNSGSNTPTEAAVNTAIIDGQTYHLFGHYGIAPDGRGYLDAESTEQENDMTILSIRGDVTQVNHTYDLTHGVEDGDYAFGVSEAYGDNFFSFQQDNHVMDGVAYFYGMINAEAYSDGIFQSGTLTINKTDAALIYKLTGVLKNGKAVSIHINIPASEWEYFEW